MKKIQGMKRKALKKHASEMREQGNTAAAEEYEAVASGKKDTVDLSQINGKVEEEDLNPFE